MSDAGFKRMETLHKLIGIEPDTFRNLLAATGWPQAGFQTCLNALIEQGVVTYRNHGGGRFYQLTRDGARLLPLREPVA